MTVKLVTQCPSIRDRVRDRGLLSVGLDTNMHYMGGRKDNQVSSQH